MGAILQQPGPLGCERPRPPITPSTAIVPSFWLKFDGSTHYATFSAIDGSSGFTILSLIHPTFTSVSAWGAMFFGGGQIRLEAMASGGDRRPDWHYPNVKSLSVGALRMPNHSPILFGGATSGGAMSPGGDWQIITGEAVYNTDTTAGGGGSPVPTWTGTFHLGNNGGSGAPGTPFKGYFGPTAIWNTKLTAAQIAAVVAAVPQLGLALLTNFGDYTAAANLKALWLMTEGSGDTVADASGNGKTLTLVGSPSWAARPAQA